MRVGACENCTNKLFGLMKVQRLRSDGPYDGYIYCDAKKKIAEAPPISVVHPYTVSWGVSGTNNPLASILFQGVSPCGAGSNLSNTNNPTCAVSGIGKYSYTIPNLGTKANPNSCSAVTTQFELDVN